MTVSQDEIDRKAKLANDEKELALEKARAEFEEWQSAQSVAARASAASNDETKAEVATAKAQVDFAKSLVPDLSKIDRGSLKASDGTVMLSSPLALGALSMCAKNVASGVAQGFPAPVAEDPDNLAATGQPVLPTILVIAGFDLATSDAAYVDFVSGLATLQTLANALRDEVEELAPSPATTEFTVDEFDFAPPLAAALSAVPAVLSLLAARRTMTTQEVPSDDDTAASVVAGALAAETMGKARVLLDSLRALPEDSAVVARRDELLRQRSVLEAALARLGTVKSVIARDLAKRIGLANKAIDSFLVAASTVEKGSTHSPLTQAMLREGLHSHEITHVLSVHASPGGAVQTLDDRPLWMQDTFSSVVALGIAFTLIDVSSGGVIRGGVELAAKGIHGRVGKELTFEFREPPA